MTECVLGPVAAGAAKCLQGSTLAAGWITWFEPYERVHGSNLAAVAAATA